MLVLSRKAGQEVIITAPDGTRLLLHVAEFTNAGTKVRLAFDAPRGWSIHRKEIQNRVDEEQRRAGQHDAAQSYGGGGV
jgi:carbon storage regulator CsrA